MVDQDRSSRFPGNCFRWFKETVDILIFVHQGFEEVKMAGGVELKAILLVIFKLPVFFYAARHGRLAQVNNVFRLQDGFKFIPELP